MGLMEDVWAYQRRSFQTSAQELGFTEYNDAYLAKDRTPLYWSVWRNAHSELGLSFYMSLEGPAHIGSEFCYPAKTAASKVSGSWYTCPVRLSLADAAGILTGQTFEVTKCIDLSEVTPERCRQIVDQYVAALDAVSIKAEPLLRLVRTRSQRA